MSGRIGKIAAVTLAALVGAGGGAIATRVTVVGASSAPPKSVVVPVEPTRLLDTRPDDPKGGPAGKLGAGRTRTVVARGVAPVPNDATGVVLNVTTVNATASSFLTLWPAGANRPLASTLNPAPDQTSFNAATVLLGDKGAFSIYNHAGSVDVIVDVVGYLQDHNHDDRYFTKAQASALFNRTVLDLQGTQGLNIIGGVATGGGCVTFASSGGSMTLPLSLPVGAKLVSLKAKARAQSSTGAMFVNLRRAEFTSSVSTESVVGTVSVTGSTNALSTFSTAVLEPVANGISYDLVVSAQATGGSLAFCGAVVDYDIDPTLVPPR